MVCVFLFTWTYSFLVNLFQNSQRVLLTPSHTKSAFTPPLLLNARPRPFEPIMCICIDRLFDDKRIAVCLLMLWLVFVIVVFKDIGLLDSKFMTFGPSVTAVFMGITLDTWYKWSMVAVFTYINTSINDFMSDALSPWILNTITDHKTKYIPYSKNVCLMIAQMWSVYCNIMGVFGLFLAMTQVDFVLIRMCADLCVNMYTNTKFLRGKVHCPNKYKSFVDSVDPDENDKTHTKDSRGEHTIDEEELSEFVSPT